MSFNRMLTACGHNVHCQCHCHMVLSDILPTAEDRDWLDPFRRDKSCIHCLKEWNSQIKTIAIKSTADGVCVFLRILAQIFLCLPLCLFVLNTVLESIIRFTVGCVPYVELPLQWATIPEKSSGMRFLFQITQLSNLIRSMNAINSQSKCF